MPEHPLLPAGLDSWEINGDEVDGPGVNEPIWPMYFDSYIGLRAIMLDQNDLDRFATDCADICINGWNDKVVVHIPRRYPVPVGRRSWA